MSERASDMMSTAVGAASVAAVFFFTFAVLSAIVLTPLCAQAESVKPETSVIAGSKKTTKTSAKAPSEAAVQTETYRNLIEKAQNLSLQNDRLQASQILLRALNRETKSSTAYKELSRALDELMSTFYTEKAQSLFVAAESNLPLKPRDAIDGFTEALHLEEGNVAVLNALARTHLVLDECDKADGFVKSAEALDPTSPEVQLLRLQVMDCAKSTVALSSKLFPIDPALLPEENFIRGLQVKDLLRRSETKRAKGLIAQWESALPDYPEIFYWKWMVSKAETPSRPDRASAQKYVQLCQNLTPRKRKSYNLDVDLCKGKEAVDAFLKESPREE